MRSGLRLTRIENALTSNQFESEIARWRLERGVGTGPHGSVYLARDPRSGQVVAIKLLAREFSSGRIASVLATAASIRHANVVPIRDVGEFDGRLYVVMPFAEGGNLRHLRAEAGPLSAEEAVSVVESVGHAVDAARWSRGLTHGSLKPENVLFSSSSPSDRLASVCVADFGLVSAAAGSGDDVSADLLQQADSPAADIAGLGRLLDFCLEPADATQWLQLVVARATTPESKDRFSTCGELIAAAREALHPPPPVVTVAMPAARPSASTRALAEDGEVPVGSGPRRTARLGRAAAVASLLVAALVVVALEWRGPESSNVPEPSSLARYGNPEAGANMAQRAEALRQVGPSLEFLLSFGSRDWKLFDSKGEPGVPRGN